jgi:hypothetical protein
MPEERESGDPGGVAFGAMVIDFLVLRERANRAALGRVTARGRMIVFEARLDSTVGDVEGKHENY